MANLGIGIIGCGNIGSIVAERALGLRMKVVAFDPFLTPERAIELGVEKADLDTLLAKADFDPPQALLHWLLVGPWRGREKLVARLGSEANDPIDELVNAAHAYAMTDVPSLVGFLHWFDAGDGEALCCAALRPTFWLDGPADGALGAFPPPPPPLTILFPSWSWMKVLLSPANRDGIAPLAAILPSTPCDRPVTNRDDVSLILAISTFNARIAKYDSRAAADGNNKPHRYPS